MKMKGLLTAILFVIGLSLIGVVSQGMEVTAIGNETTVPALINLVQPEPETAVAATILTAVDRDDDPDALYPCTEAPNDCTLRSAMAIANNDGVPTDITFADHYLITLSRPLPNLAESHTVIRARPEQEVHVNGNRLPASVFYITGANVTLEGLRIYGAGENVSNIRVNGAAHSVIIARNVIGDEDAPSGNCGSSDKSYGGIYVDGTAAVETAVRVWIYGNIIECHKGLPGDGITIMTNNVVVGQDSEGDAGAAQRNVMRWNNGYGIRLNGHSGNTIENNLAHDNGSGGLHMTNYNNNVMGNEWR
jgi:hypothetical protein